MHVLFDICAGMAIVLLIIQGLDKGWGWLTKRARQGRVKADKSLV